MTHLADTTRPELRLRHIGITIPYAVCGRVDVYTVDAEAFPKAHRPCGNCKRVAAQRAAKKGG